MAERCLIQSYVGKEEDNCYFVSTIYRRSSGMFGGYYYETLVWKVDAKTFERGEMLHLPDVNTRSDPKYRAAALVHHAEICARIAERSDEWGPEDDE